MEVSLAVDSTGTIVLQWGPASEARSGPSLLKHSEQLGLKLQWGPASEARSGRVGAPVQDCREVASMGPGL